MCLVSPNPVTFSGTIEKEKNSFPLRGGSGAKLVGCKCEAARDHLCHHMGDPASDGNGDRREQS